MSVYDRVERTRSLARIFGPYLLIMAATLFVRQESLPDLFSAFMQDAPLVLAGGAFTLMAGLGVIAAHHHWNSAAAAAISLVGVAAAFKGAWLMIAPDLGAEMTAVFAEAPYALMITACVEGLIGLWLTIVGWRARPPSATV